MQKRVVRGPVKSFGPDGVLRRNRYSVEDAEVFLKRRMVYAKRNSKGVITQIWFLGSELFPHMPKFKAGTRYSSKEAIGERRQQWKLNRVSRHSHVFFAVLDSISLTKSPDQPKPTNVVSIDAFQTRRQAERPALLAA